MADMAGGGCRLAVVAYDGGVPARSGTLVRSRVTLVRSGTLVVDVSVRDVNDNVPRFPGNATFAATVSEDVAVAATVSEDVAVGTVVATVRAGDADSGANARIRYALSPETARDHGRTFGVRADSGELFTRAALDHESRAHYALYVTASDRGAETGNDVIGVDWDRSRSDVTESDRAETRNDVTASNWTEAETT